MTEIGSNVKILFRKILVQYGLEKRKIKARF